MTRIVLDPDSPRDVEMVARVLWEFESVTERPFEDLRPAFRRRLTTSAAAILRDLAGQSDAVRLPVEPAAAA